MSRTVTIAYDRSSQYAWPLPNRREDDVYAVRFTSGISGRLYRANLMFADRPDSGTVTVSVWTDDGGRPGGLIGARKIGPVEIFPAPVWTTVSLLGLGIEVGSDESFFIGLSFSGAGGDTLYLVSDDGEAADTGRSLVRSGSGSWESMEQIYGSGYNFRIRAMVNQPLEGGGIVPGLFALYPNYPNPFNIKTTIRFEIPTEGEVRIDIYDVLGHRVRSLVAESLAAGRHRRVWDGRDDRSGSLPSGVYFYRLKASGYASTRKMVLLK
jgi:hypothetical protein